MIVDVSSLISRSRLNIYEILSMRYFTAQGVCRVIKQHSDALRFGHTLPLGRALMAQAWKMNSSGVRPAEDPPWEVTTLWEENKDKRNDTEKKKAEPHSETDCAQENSPSASGPECKDTIALQAKSFSAGVP